MFILFIIFFFILGLIFGSFINCLVYRLKIKETILGHSFCPHCRHQLGFFDLFPLFSYLFLGAKCRYCQKKISIQYFLVELIVGFLFAGGYWFYLASGIYLGVHPILILGLYILITIFLAIIFLFDLKYYLVNDLVIYLGVISVLIYRLFLDFNLINTLIGMGVGFLFFGAQYFLSKGKWLGSGDIFIGILMGVILGWPNILVAIFISYIIGGIWASILLIFKLKKLSAKLPLGPFLTFSTWLVFLLGDKILNWYLNLIGVL